MTDPSAAPSEPAAETFDRLVDLDSAKRLHERILDVVSALDRVERRDVRNPEERPYHDEPHICLSVEHRPGWISVVCTSRQPYDEDEGWIFHKDLLNLPDETIRRAVELHSIEYNIVLAAKAYADACARLRDVRAMFRNAQDSAHNEAARGIATSLCVQATEDFKRRMDSLVEVSDRAMSFEKDAEALRAIYPLVLELDLRKIDRAAFEAHSERAIKAVQQIEEDDRTAAALAQALAREAVKVPGGLEELVQGL